MAPSRNEEPTSLEDGLPRLKEENLEKSSEELQGHCGCGL